MNTTRAALLTTTLFLAACGSDGADTPAADSDATVATDAATTEPAVTEPAVTEPTDTQPTTEPTPTEPADTEPADTEPADVEPPDSAPTPAEDATPTDTNPSASPDGGFSLNGFRYCEILMTVPGENGAPVTEVWGTPGVDPCEDADWNAIDPDEVAAANDATWIDMNGPRYFTVDGTADTGDGSGDGGGIAAGGESETRQFGGVSMQLLATVDGASTDGIAYVPELVVRTTTWTFEAGTEVYELTDPEGETYVMQSYALIVDPDLDAADLPTLGERLDLPEGWSYGARVLDAPLQVALAEGGALVVADELRNSYQRNG